jgi:hypothetical protein
VSFLNRVRVYLAENHTPAAERRACLASLRGLPAGYRASPLVVDGQSLAMSAIYAEYFLDPSDDPFASGLPAVLRERLLEWRRFDARLRRELATPQSVEAVALALSTNHDDVMYRAGLLQLGDLPG